jgi:hypothetical protein
MFAGYFVKAAPATHTTAEQTHATHQPRLERPAFIPMGVRTAAPWADHESET